MAARVYFFAHNIRALHKDVERLQRPLDLAHVDRSGWGGLVRQGHPVCRVAAEGAAIGVDPSGARPLSKLDVSGQIFEIIPHQ